MPHTDPAPAPHDTSSGPPPPPGIGRVEAFSDGVIAIIITIMVLELKPPQLHAVNSMWTEILVPMWPKLLAYAWSFLAVGSMWINHHHLLNSLRSASRPLAWLNLQLLFWMSLVPVSTALIGEHPTVPGAVATFALVLAANLVSFLMLRRYAQGLAPGQGARGVHSLMVRRNLMGAAMNVAGAVAAFIWLPLGYVLIAGAPLLFFASPKQAREVEEQE